MQDEKALTKLGRPNRGKGEIFKSSSQQMPAPNLPSSSITGLNLADHKKSKKNPSRDFQASHDSQAIDLSKPKLS